MKVEYWIKENSSNQIHILHVDTPIGIFVALHQRATYSPRLFRARLDPHPRQSPTPSISVFSHKIYQHVPAIVPPEMATSPFLKRLSLDAAQRRTIRSEFLRDAGPQCGGWCLKGAGVNPPTNYTAREAIPGSRYRIDSREFTNGAADGLIFADDLRINSPLPFSSAICSIGVLRCKESIVPLKDGLFSSTCSRGEYQPAGAFFGPRHGL